jgi:DNA-binding response OmpR family regulator
MIEENVQKVLVVDDNVENLNVVVNTLNNLDINPLIAQSGEEAIRMAVKLQPDLILLDIMMPVIDGFEVVRRLKEFEGTAAIPIIFLTAADQTANILCGFEIGAVDYINKPFIPEELLARVSTHLRTIKINNELRFLLSESEKQKAKLNKLNKKNTAKNIKIKKKNQILSEKNKFIETQANNMAGINQQLQIINRELDARKLELEFINNEILSSIRYAQTIQNALLPDKETTDRIFSEYFVYYNPKEAVGGDFYYLKKNENQILFCVADCTGHGVPGALLTMLGISYLDQITANSENSEPATILEELREYIKNIFINSETKSSGMDAVFCKIDTKTARMEFASAFMPFFVVRNSEAIEMKTDKNPVGYFPVEKPFQNQEFQLEENDIIYLFSDGYIDQFGEKFDKKFRTRQLKKLLIEISRLSMSEQKKILDQTFANWKGNTEQTDDVLVVGVKITNKEINFENI